jgi:hypothetical protein
LHFVDNLICNGMAQVVMPTNKNKGFSALLPHLCASSPKCPLPLAKCLKTCNTIRVKGIQPMRTITKAQALEQFRYNWMATNSTDKVAKREAWGIFTDELCREGYITMKKYESWSNPF